MEFELTKEERNAINTLKRLEKRWPKTLWLFATGMSISIMRCDKNEGHAITKFEGMDPDYIVDSVHIDNDGGDW